MEHVIVYKKERRYAAWPANYGIWSWGDEIVVGFTSGYHLEEGGFHARDRTKPFVAYQARSLDGGFTWESLPMPLRVPGNFGLSAGEHMNAPIDTTAVMENAPVPVQKSIDFLNSNFAMMFGRESLDRGSSWFYTSLDRCQSWQGPFQLSKMGQLGLAARTDYIVSSSDHCLVFLTAPTVHGKETGSRVFCSETLDGGQHFTFKSWITSGREDGFSIMPASVRLSEDELLVATRERKELGNNESKDWIDLYVSGDNGETWSLRSQPAPCTGRGGNPPTLTKLFDGRLCITYAYRNAPFRIVAKLSDDEGRTWSNEIVLRQDGGSHDIGYPRTIQRPDGKMVTVYYFNDRLDGACYIAATIWEAL